MKAAQFIQSIIVLSITIIAFSFTVVIAKSTTDNKPSYAVGEITPSALIENYPKFDNSKSKIGLNNSAIKSLSSIKQKIHLRTFLGTWCHDSEREVPRLMDVLTAAQNSNLNLTLFALDHHKSDPEGQAKHYKIVSTPTIIVERDGVEIGRITEKPRLSLEQDLIIILNKR